MWCRQSTAGDQHLCGPVIAQLQAALDALEAARGSINHKVDIDLNFHRLLCELTGNTTLLRSWEALAGSIRMSIMFSGTDKAITDMSLPHHQKLIDVIATGDPDTARASFIGQAGYDEDTGIMAVDIRGTLRYAVPRIAFSELKVSDHPGQVHNELVRGNRRAEVSRCSRCRRHWSVGAHEQRDNPGLQLSSGPRG